MVWALPGSSERAGLRQQDQEEAVTGHSSGRSPRTKDEAQESIRVGTVGARSREGQGPRDVHLRCPRSLQESHLGGAGRRPYGCHGQEPQMWA